MMTHRRHTRCSRRQGFTLLELSVVLALISVIVGGGLVVLTASVQTSQYNATINRMNALDAALLNYRVAFNRLPCPADLAQPPSSATYGMEAGGGNGSSIAIGTGACTGTGMVPQASSSGNNGGDTVAEGAVPTRALRLPDNYMYDGWGRRFRYAVDVTMTATNAFTTTSISPAICSNSAISVTDSSDTAGSRTSAAIYAIVSHGANGHGGYTANGVPFNAGSVNADEQTNCHCTSSAAVGTYTPAYVQKLPTMDTGNALDNFDDIVSYKTLAQLQTQQTTETVSKCIYVAATDVGNARVNVYFLNGTPVMELGAGYNNVPSSGTGSGQLSFPRDVAIDNSGNFWVADQSNEYIVEYSSNGQFVKNLGSSGYLPGQFYNLTGVAVDSQNNIWVADASNNRVQEFNQSGTWMQTIPSGCTNLQSPACTAGAANGQFYSPSNITLDSAGNVWVTDYGNYRIQKFSSSGTLTLPPNGTDGCQTSTIPACTQNNFSNPYMYAGKIAFDAAGYIWSGDSYGNLLQSSPTTGAIVNEYNNNYAGYYIQNLAIDPYNNIWAGTTSPYVHLQKINHSGTLIGSIGSTGNATGQFGSTYVPPSVSITPSW